MQKQLSYGISILALILGGICVVKGDWKLGGVYIILSSVQFDLAEATP